MNAITVPKNPPTAMMGIRTSIGSSRRRSFTRSDPLALAVLREQPFGEVHTLGELRHLTPHGLELLIERILLFRALGAQIAATGRGALAADPVGHRAADRREGHRESRAAPENDGGWQDGFHTRQLRRAGRAPPPSSPRSLPVTRLRAGRDRSPSRRSSRRAGCARSRRPYSPCPPTGAAPRAAGARPGSAGRWSVRPGCRGYGPCRVWPARWRA